MPAFVQATGGFASTAGTSLAQAYGGAVKSGSTLICCADSSTAGGVQTVSDNLNGAWAPVPLSLANDGARTAQIWYLRASVAGTPTVTLTVASNANYRALMVAEYSGVYGVDRGASGTGTGTAESVVVPITILDDLAVGGTFSVNTVTPTSGNDRVNTNGDHFVDTLAPALGTFTFSFTQATGGWSVAGASFAALSQLFRPHRVPLGA